MSDTFTDDEPTGETQESHNIKLLREKAEAGEKATRELAQAKRELAVLQSGIDVESPAGKLFLKAYDGDNTVEAIKAAAEEYAIPLKGEQTPEPEAVEEPPVDSGTDTRRSLADAAPVGSEPTPDPNKLALDAFQEALASGAREEAAQAVFFNILAEAASRGDERVIVR